MGKPKKEAVKPEEPKKDVAKPTTSTKEAVKPPEQKGTSSKVKEALAKAVAKSGTKTVPVPVPVVPPPPPLPPVVIEKPKRKRFVREKKEKVVQAAPVKLPERSTKATAKLMTKGLALPPKEDTTGQKPRA